MAVAEPYVVIPPRQPFHLSVRARRILGGDLAFSLVQREANDSERAFIDARGTVSVAATLPNTMAASRKRCASFSLESWRIETVMPKGNRMQTPSTFDNSH